jgi:hypothetical protein
MNPPGSFAAAVIELLWVGVLVGVAGFCWTIGAALAGRLFGGRAPH